jgi:hypothetical protein
VIQVPFNVFCKICFADWVTEMPPIHKNDTSEHQGYVEKLILFQHLKRNLIQLPPFMYSRVRTLFCHPVSKIDFARYVKRHLNRILLKIQILNICGFTRVICRRP